MREWLHEEGILPDESTISEEVMFDRLKKNKNFLAAVNLGVQNDSTKDAVQSLRENKAEIVQYCRDGKFF